MREVNVSIEINGKQTLVGKIEGNDYRDARFSYDDRYLGIQGIKPVSISLPLQSEAFSSDATRFFFEGLLPEGFSRKSVANWAKAHEDDYLTIIENLGQECLGAIQIYHEDSPVIEGSYELLDIDRVKALAAEGATTSTQILLETHLSLTGASGKVGLYYDRLNDEWYLPIGNAASTHIVKQSHVRHDQIVLNEQLCMMIAKNVGIEVPESFIINVGNGEDESVLYATKRYDRHMSEIEGVNGFSLPYRLHQEDFAQALSIHAGNKYETYYQGFMKRMFDLVRNYSGNPVEDQLKLWDIIVFHYLIGNTDGHIKNFSFLYDSGLKGMRLAPAYDLVCTRAYRTTNDMSFFIGGELAFDKISRENFANAAKAVGLGERIAMKHFDEMSDKMENAINKAAEELTGNNINAMPMAGRILEASGYRQL